MLAVVLDDHQRAAGQGLVEPEQAVGQLLHFGQGAAFNPEQKFLFPVPGHHDRDRFCLGAGLVYGAAGGTAYRLGIQRGSAFHGGPVQFQQIVVPAADADLRRRVPL